MQITVATSLFANLNSLSLLNLKENDWPTLDATLLQSVYQNSSILYELTLVNSRCHDDVLLSILRVSSRLAKIKLDSCREITDEGLKRAVAVVYHSLERLQLLRMKNILLPTLKWILKEAGPRLNSVDVFDCCMLDRAYIDLALSRSVKARRR